MAEKEENADSQHFLLSHNVCFFFLQRFSSGLFESQHCVVKGKNKSLSIH